MKNFVLFRLRYYWGDRLQSNYIATPTFSFQKLTAHITQAMILIL